MNILLIFGGDSTESEISILTAKQIEEMNNKHKIFPILMKNNKFFLCKKLDIAKCANFDFDKKFFKEIVIAKKSIFEVNKKLKKIADADCAIVACHGGKGENGELAAHLLMCDLPCSSGEPLGLGLAMDKILSKAVLEKFGISVVEGFDFCEEQWNNDNQTICEKANKMGFPLCVKPSRQGSSVGISFVKNQDQFERAVTLALEFDDKILVERGLENFREINVSVVRSASRILVSEAEEPERSCEILSFFDKYLSGSKCKKNNIKTCKTPSKMPKMNFKNGKHEKFGMVNLSRKFPADLTIEEKNEIEKMAKRAVEIFDIRGILRIDFLLCDGKIFLNEINSVPGSLAYYFWKDKCGQEFFDMLVDLCFDCKKPKQVKVAKILK